MDKTQLQASFDPRTTVGLYSGLVHCPGLALVSLVSQGAPEV